MELKLRKWLRYHLIFSLVWKAIVFPLESQDTNWSQWNAFRFVNIKAKVIKAFLSKKPICPGHENCNRTEAETEKKRHVRWERAKIRINPFAGRSVGVLHEAWTSTIDSTGFFFQCQMVRFATTQLNWMGKLSISMEEKGGRKEDPDLHRNFWRSGKCGSKRYLCKCEAQWRPFFDGSFRYVQRLKLWLISNTTISISIFQLKIHTADATTPEVRLRLIQSNNEQIFFFKTDMELLININWQKAGAECISCDIPSVQRTVHVRVASLYLAL